MITDESYEHNSTGVPFIDAILINTSGLSMSPVMKYMDLSLDLYMNIQII